MGPRVAQHLRRAAAGLAHDCARRDPAPIAENPRGPSLQRLASLGVPPANLHGLIAGKLIASQEAPVHGEALPNQGGAHAYRQGDSGRGRLALGLDG